MIIEGGVYTFDNVIKIIIHNRYGIITSYQLLNYTKTFTRETINETVRELIENNSLNELQFIWEDVNFFKKNQDGYLGKIDDMCLNLLADFNYRLIVGE